MSLEINLFGEFRVRRAEILLERREWGRQKTRSLLKLLLTRSGRAFSRDEILEALWPGTPPEAAERSLRVTVSRLRRALGQRGPGRQLGMRHAHAASGLRGALRLTRDAAAPRRGQPKLARGGGIASLDDHHAQTIDGVAPIRFGLAFAARAART